jgi:hypothetical protein
MPDRRMKLETAFDRIRKKIRPLSRSSHPILKMTTSADVPLWLIVSRDRKARTVSLIYKIG